MKPIWFEYDVMKLFIRSKTFDPSLLSQVQSDTETKLERKKSQSNQVSVFTMTKMLKANMTSFIICSG